MKQYSELIHFFRLCLEHQIIDNQEIIQWANTIIEMTENPNFLIIELALCEQKNRNEIISLITEHIGRKNCQIAERAFLGRLYNYLINNKIVLEKTTSSMYRLALDCELTQEEKGYLYNFDEFYYLVKDAIILKTIKELENEIKAFLTNYKDLQVTNFELWKEINETLTI